MNNEILIVLQCEKFSNFVPLVWKLRNPYCHTGTFMALFIKARFADIILPREMLLLTPFVKHSVDTIKYLVNY